MTILDQILNTSKKNVSLEEIEVTSSIERAYSSSVRNIIILFTLGITILRFSTNNISYLISSIFILCGIAMGIVSTREYYSRIDKIIHNKYDKYNMVSYTSLVVMCGFIILIISILIFFIFNYFKKNKHKNKSNKNYKINNNSYNKKII
jgi:hypothetical protein